MDDIRAEYDDRASRNMLPTDILIEAGDIAIGALCFEEHPEHVALGIENIPDHG